MDATNATLKLFCDVLLPDEDEHSCCPGNNVNCVTIATRQICVSVNWGACRAAHDVIVALFSRLADQLRDHGNHPDVRGFRVMFLKINAMAIL